MAVASPADLSATASHARNHWGNTQGTGVALRAAMNTLTLRRVGLAAATSVILVASLAHAAPIPTPRTLDVEISDTSKQSTETMKFLLAMDGTRPTKLSMAAGDFAYQLDARCDGVSAGALPITLKLFRGDHRSGSPGRIDLEVNVAVAVGTRTVVATATRPDGSHVELAVRAH